MIQGTMLTSIVQTSGQLIQDGQEAAHELPTYGAEAIAVVVGADGAGFRVFVEGLAGIAEGLILLTCRHNAGQLSVGDN
jgi:hypothetical protein